jgi:hypothetical protein
MCLCKLIHTEERDRMLLSLLGFFRSQQPLQAQAASETLKRRKITHRFWRGPTKRGQQFFSFRGITGERHRSRCHQMESERIKTMARSACLSGLADATRNLQTAENAKAEKVEKWSG